MSNLEKKDATEKKTINSHLKNSNKGTFGGRTVGGWLKLLLFFVIYYSFLAVMWVGLLYIHLNYVVSSSKPYLTGEYSLLRDGPGLSFSPIYFDAGGTPEGTLVYMNSTDNRMTKRYLETVNNLFSKYAWDDRLRNCDKEVNFDKDRACFFNITTLGKCATPAEVIKQQRICTYIAVNRIYGWLPDIIDNTTDITVNCSGSEAADSENLGSITYYPSTADGKYGKISTQYFPYLSQSVYHSPLLALFFDNPTRNVLVRVTCNLNNIRDLKLDKMQFEVLLDDV